MVDYYSKGRQYEPKDVIRDWDLNFNLGNVIKYVSRCGRKDDSLDGVLSDLIKAKNYIQFEIDYVTKNHNVEGGKENE